MDYDQIPRVAEQQYKTCVRLRRDLHRFAETGWLEMRTSAIIAKELTGMGYEVLTGRAVCEEKGRMGVPDDNVLKEHATLIRAQGLPEEFLSREMEAGFTGVIGILRCGEGPVTALRFDIDGLGIVESETDGHRPYREGFSSKNKGMMHACGHDSHTAIGIGTAAILAHMKESLHGTAKLIFQPAEEGVRGARAIVEKGHLDDVDYFLGAHVESADHTPGGLVTPGTYGSLATTKYDVHFNGKASHAGSFPEQGSNAILAGACAALNLAAIPRHSKGENRVNVGTFHGGTGRNVIPDKAVLEIEVRGETSEINSFMDERAAQICRSAADMYGCEAELIKMGASESHHSDVFLAERIGEIIKSRLPLIPVTDELCLKNSGSEDIALMMNRVQQKGGLASCMRLMTAMAAAPHTPEFDLDETVILRGMEVFSMVTCELMKKE